VVKPRIGGIFGCGEIVRQYSKQIPYAFARRIEMKSIAVLTVAGLAAAATAGTSVNIYFEADRSEAVFGDSVTWSVYADSTGFAVGNYFGGFVGEFVASDNSLAIAGFVTSFMGGNATTPQVGVDASIRNINVFNSALLGTNNPANPILFMTFQSVIAATSGELSYAADGDVSWFPNSGIFALPVVFDGLTVSGSDRVSIVPAPGAFALMGLGGLAATRRRR
jgi:MYXO-CTERM domain-containing protein